jgi:peptidyl-prolyl cis-trans isomerase SurA
MSRPPPGASRALPIAAVLGALALLPVAGAGPAAGQPSGAAPAQAAPSNVNRIVAVVNGEVVSRADVVSRARLFAMNAGIAVAPDTLARLTPQVTRLLIDERLRLQEVQRRRIPVSDKDVAEAVGELERRNGLPPGALRLQLERVGIQPRVLYDQIRTQIGWSRLLRLQLGPQAQPSDEEVADAIRNAKARAGEPEFLVSEIFVPSDDPKNERETRAFVEEVIGQLRRGTPFPVAATQFSQAQSALQGGDLGWVSKDQLDPDVSAVVQRMPPGAVSNPIKVAGGWQIVTLRERRESGRDIATLLTIRQAIFAFTTPLDPDAPTAQQREAVDRAQRLSETARNCEAVAAANRSDRPADPGQIRLETVSPPPLKALLAGLAPNRASQPIITPDGVIVMMVCARETRNLAELTPEEARSQLLRDRVENLSRQLQRDLRRRAQIDLRTAEAASQ